MRNKLIIVLAGLFLTPAWIIGQDIGQPVSPQASEIWRKTQEADRINSENTRKADSFRRSAGRNDGQVTTTRVNASELTGKAKEYLKPDAVLQDKYKSFLQLPNTGIITLLSDKNYLKNYPDPKIKFEKLVEICPFRFIPGSGSFFSFRQNDYVNYPLADIGFQDNLIFSLGTLNQGILVNLGNVDIKDVSPDSSGIDYLFKYTPAATLEGAAKESRQFEDGLKIGNFSYKNTAIFETDKTYGLRVVAYRASQITRPAENNGEKQLSLSDTESGKGTKINPFENDRREDIIVVFRIVEKHDDGTVILLWRELKNGQSPELSYSVPAASN